MKERKEKKRKEKRERKKNPKTAKNRGSGTGGWPPAANGQVGLRAGCRSSGGQGKARQGKHHGGQVVGHVIPSSSSSIPYLDTHTYILVTHHQGNYP